MLFFYCFLNLCNVFAYLNSYGVRFNNLKVLCSDYGEENSLIPNLFMVFMSLPMSIIPLLIFLLAVPVYIVLYFQSSESIQDLIYWIALYLSKCMLNSVPHAKHVVLAMARQWRHWNSQTHKFKWVVPWGVPVRENLFADRDPLLANPTCLTCSAKQSLHPQNVVWVENVMLSC